MKCEVYLFVKKQVLIFYQNHIANTKGQAVQVYKHLQYLFNHICVYCSHTFLFLRYSHDHLADASYSSLPSKPYLLKKSNRVDW